MHFALQVAPFLKNSVIIILGIIQFLILYGNCGECDHRLLIYGCEIQEKIYCPFANNSDGNLRHKISSPYINLCKTSKKKDNARNSANVISTKTWSYTIHTFDALCSNNKLIKVV